MSAIDYCACYVHRMYKDENDFGIIFYFLTFREWRFGQVFSDQYYRFIVAMLLISIILFWRIHFPWISHICKIVSPSWCNGNTHGGVRHIGKILYVHLREQNSDIENRQLSASNSQMRHVTHYVLSVKWIRNYGMCLVIMMSLIRRANAFLKTSTV